MALVKDKVVTVESLSALHEHNQDTFMTKVDPSGSGTMDFDGNINIYSGDVTISGVNNGVYCIHPDTEIPSSMVHMNPNGATVIGHGGYENENGDSFICGNDLEHHIASAKVRYRPYYRVGDVIDIHVRTSGYTTNLGHEVSFTIPLTKPIIGEPILEITSEKGFILRQDGKYTHGSYSSASEASTYVQPYKYIVDNNFNTGIIVSAMFEDITNVINNDSIGIYFDGQIILIDQNEV